MQLLTKEQQNQLDDAWLGLSVPEEKLFNPLMTIPLDDKEAHLYLTYLLRQPDYFPVYTKEILGIEMFPMQSVILKTLWNHRFPIFVATRGGTKTFLLALYSILRATFIPGRKIVIAGSVFRQSKLVFEYILFILSKSPYFKHMCRTYEDKYFEKGNTQWRLIIGDSTITGIPIGDGGSVRGLRANDLIVEEFASHNRDIFETVLSGFIAVSSNPVEKLKEVARQKLADRMGIEIESQTNLLYPDNQMILCGTAYYQFNHFYEYWKLWKRIIESKDLNLLKRTEDEQIDKSLRPDDFCIIRIPVDLIPEGFMDSAQIARSKASMHSGNYDCEFNAIFAADSNGFYRRSLLETCVCRPGNEFLNVVYHHKMYGDPSKRYVMGVDVASEKDNFAIIVIEIDGDLHKIVYGWTITRKEQKERVSDGIINENDFYSYCCVKIRELMRAFKIEKIGMDSQGGGIAILEGLSRVDENSIEKPLYETIDPKKFKETDTRLGLHIVEMINFASSEWTRLANYTMRKDFEQRTLLFPCFDPLSFSFAEASDESLDKKYDTMEDCVYEIEQLKDELSSIIVTETATGREKWDTPDTKISAQVKKKMKKDRYSALLIANYIARTLDDSPQQITTELGGFAYRIKYEEHGPLFTGPQNLVQKFQNLY